MSGETDDSLSKGEVFELLSNHRRRYVIHLCKNRGESMSIGTLAEQIAAWENDKPVDDITAAERKRVYTSLQQTHLPTLADANMITYDDKTVELTSQAGTLDVYLDIVPGGSIPWGVYYFGLSVIGFGVLAGVASGILPADVLPAVGWTALVLGVFLVSAIIHVYQSHQHRLSDTTPPP